MGRTHHRDYSNYPGKSGAFLSMHFLGGLSLEQWYPSMLEHVTNHGKNMNCSAIEGNCSVWFLEVSEAGRL